jgi:DNA (cytosine-5)-methyltransferase 1
MQPVADKCARTRAKVARQQAKLGLEEWVFCYRGKGYGYSLDDTLGTITTKDQWAYVRGGSMRFLQPSELRDAMGFPAIYALPATPKKLAVHMLGNSVAPPVGRAVIGAGAAAIRAARGLRLAA